MSESKHTPGPWDLATAEQAGDWSVEPGSRGDCSWHCIRGRGQTIAIAVTDHERADAFGALTFAANARLIAAAPDLLEALKGLLSRADEHLLAYVALTERDAARAAIAKATGAA